MSRYQVSPDRVSVKSIQKFRLNSGGLRWRVKWRVAGDEKTRSFKTRALADAFRAELVAATSARGWSMFDPDTGLPAEWTISEAAKATFLDMAIVVVESDWKSIGAKHRMGRVEALAQMAASATKPGGPDKQMLRLVLRNWVLPPDSHRTPIRPLTVRKPGKTVTYTTSEVEAAIQWVVRHSQLMRSLDSVDAVGKLLDRSALSVVTGRPLKSSSRDKNRSAASVVYAEAVRVGAVSNNHIRNVRQHKYSSHKVAEPEAVPSPAQARELVDALSTISKQAVHQYRAFFTLMWCCGTRPSELYGLRFGSGFDLPETGWGSIVLRNPLVGSSSRWTDDGETAEQRHAMKARTEGSVRVIHVPPEAVQELRAHIQRTKPAHGDHLFRNSVGKPLDQSAVAEVWRKCRRRACGGRFTLPLYELRHTAGSTMLEAGNSPATVAAQLGNSVAVLQRTYARTVADTNAASRFASKMDTVLGAEEQSVRPIERAASM